jgi:hypothetical protein
MAKTEAADKADIPQGMSIPDQLARREHRLPSPKLARRSKPKARSASRGSRPSMKPNSQAREAKTKASGKTPGGRPPVGGALPADQIKLTDEESHIMPVARGGFEQCYNA